MKNFLLFTLAALHSTFSPAQNTFQKTFYNVYHDANCQKIIRSADSNYIILGNETVYPAMIKMNDAGDTIWSRTTLTDDYGSIVLCNDGGYMITGSNVHPMVYSDFILLKTDSTGNPELERYYGTTLNEDANAICLTHDNGFIAAGYRVPNNSQYSHSCIMRFDSVGNILWAKQYEMDTLSYLNSVLPTSDGGFIVVGTLGITRTSNILLMKIDSSGQPIITKKIGDEYFENGTEIIPAVDSGFIVSGYSDRLNTNGDFHALLMNVDDSLNIRWSKMYGSTIDDRAEDVIAVNNHYVFTGTTFFNSFRNNWIVETDANGNPINGWKWNVAHGSYSNTICPTYDGGFLVGGINWPTISTSELSVDKLSASLRTCSGSIETPSSTIDTLPITSITPIVTNLTILIGTLTNTIGTGINQNISCMAGTSGMNEINLESDLIIFPNPSDGTFNIVGKTGIKLIEAFTQDGKKIYWKLIEGSPTLITVDLHEYPSGIYFLKINDIYNKESNRRIVVMN